MEIEEGDIVVCTVEKIVGTNVFVKIQGNGEGSIVFSEIAPGRIRNIRDYVVPKKKIICKVLRIKENNIELSLRRVTHEETKNKLEEIKQEKSYKSIIKTLLGEKSKEIIDKIEKSSSVYELFNEAKENSKLLETYIPKAKSTEIYEILKSQKPKSVVLKKNIQLFTSKPDGILRIKKLLQSMSEIRSHYISAGNYSISIESESGKDAGQKMKKMLKEIEEKSKKEEINFSIKEK